MNKKMIVCALWCVAAACTIVIVASRLSWGGKMKLPVPQPDKIATSTASDGAMRIRNETAGYAITVLRDWYLEKSVGSGMTIYPDYNAADKASLDCKIEISTFLNESREGLADWLAAYFHRDPTANVSEILRTTTTIGGGSAIIWHGVLDGISSTLAYIATGTAIYEIAPSGIMGISGATIDADCEDDFENVLKNFQFIK